MADAATTAKATLAAHLTADRAVAASAVAGSVDKLTGGATLTVEASGSAWGPWRTLVELDVTAWVRYRQASDGDAALTLLMDRAQASVVALRSNAAAHWMGPSTDLAWGDAETAEHDGARYATAVLSLTMAVPSDHQRVVGESESVVQAALTAAGLTVVGGSDIPPILTTRWGGNSAADPYTDDVLVVAAEELESGRIEEAARGVWQVLYQADGIAIVDAIDIDPAGQPPGSDGSYETAAVMCRVLNPRRV